MTPTHIPVEPQVSSIPSARPLYGRLRARAVILGLLLVPLDCWWAIRTEIISGGSEMIEGSLLVLVVFILFVLVLLNGLALRRLPRAAFTRAELLFVYILQTTSVGLAGLGQMQVLSQALGGAYYWADKQNGWSSFQRFIPRWWVPDPSVLKAYYKGNSTFFTAEHMRGWAVPITVWCVFVMMMLFCFLCLNTMLRKHWVEHERLTFPLVAIPLELTNTESTGLLRQRKFWLAFSMACVFRSISGMHRIMPDFPEPSEFAFKGQLIYINQYFTTPPWNSIGFFAVSFHPMIVGITYLLPLDVSFSSWFFYLATKAENVLAGGLGLNTSAAGSFQAIAPYTAEQGAGAFLGIALLSFWGARRHLREVAAKAFGRSSRVRDDDEPLSYRTALFGFLGSFAGMVIFVTLGGMPWYLPALFFLLYLLMITTVTRLRAVAGPMLTFGPDLNPHQMMVNVPGSWSWGERDQTPFAYLNWFDSDYRTVAMPQQMEAFKIREQAPDIGPRQMTAWILVAGLIAAIASFVSVLAIYYHYGALTPRGDNAWRIYNGQMPFLHEQTWLHNPTGPDMTRILWVGIGFLTVIGLNFAHTYSINWPFHPAGYALANAGYTMAWVWFPTLLGWLAKLVILRYGGLKLYRRAMPFFMGLILGDIVVASVWSIVGVLMGTQMYMFFPG